MSTTTIRLSDELKSRVALAAKRAGTTAHNFILEAIAEKTREQEQREDFRATAERRFTAIAETGQTISWSEAREYLQRRAAGKTATRPSPKKLAR